MNKKGRPLSKSSQERRRNDDLLRNLNAQHSMTESEADELNKILKNMEFTDNEVLKNNRVSPTMPKKHAYEMASIGPEMTDSQIKSLLEKDKIYSEEISQYRNEGSRTTQEASLRKAEILYKKNKQVIDQISPFGTRTVNEVANAIKNDWDSRGYLGPLPTEKTIQNLILKALKQPTKFGKGSL